MQHLSGEVEAFGFAGFDYPKLLTAYNCCVIKQEEYDPDDKMGKLECGHGYHVECIKQWLAQKNACPVCKTAAVGRG